MLDDFDIDAPEGPPPEESDNRTFLMVAGGLGGFALLSLICLAAVLFLRGGDGGDPDFNATEAAIDANNTEVALAAEQTGTAVALLPTNTPTLEITATLEPTSTPTSDDIGPTEITPGGPTVHPATATVQALLTQAAIAQTQAAQEILTVTPTATALPDTGFADDVGLFGMFTLGSALVLVIFFARRLRAANA